MIKKNKYKKLEKLCLEAITENKCVFIDEIFCLTEISPSLFYEAGLEDSEVLKDMVEKNRAELKRELRLKWLDSTNATLNAALYKLVCTEHERKLFGSSSSAKNISNDQNYTQEEFLKSLKEMGDNLEGADSAD